MLLIDCHEPNAIIEKLKLSIPVSMLTLKYGDYSFADTIIERKTLSDFFSSIKNNRLREQMENISRFYTDKYLLIEGFFDFGYINNVEYLYSQLIGIMLSFDVKIIFSKDTCQTADIISRLYHQRNFKQPLNVMKRHRAYHLAKFFGVSEKKLGILLSRFHSIKSIANAENKEFKGIKTIGRKTIEKIKSALDSNVLE